MNIAVVGTGYVGLVSGACFAEMGAVVTCVDVDRKKVEMLRSGVLPIYEPGLEDIVARNHREGRLEFSEDLASCIDSVEIVFIAVGTPPDEDGSADLSHVLEVASSVGRLMKRYLLLVTIRLLLDAGCRVKVYDPVAMDECRRRIGDSVEYALDMYEAVQDADAFLLLTEWKQFRMPSWPVIRNSMRRPLVIDGRNIYDAAELEGAGFLYSSIGRKTPEFEK